MRDHIIGEDYELWDIVTDSPLATMKKNDEGIDVSKTRADCTAEDLRKWGKTAKAKKWLVCGFGQDEYIRIQSCTTAKEIWDTLQVAYEGTPQVKISRGTLLYSQYENFTMNEGKTIQEMYTRVQSVTWESKITVIQESKNIATLKLDELIENITAYELRRKIMKMDYLKRGKGPSRSGSYSKPKVPERQTNEGCYKCGKTDHHIKNCLQWEIEWKKEIAERRNGKKEQEYHSSNRRGLGFGNLPPKWDPKSKYLTLPENKICTHCGKIGHNKSECNAKEKVLVKWSSQIWYMYSGCSKHMSGSKNQEKE
ncbi:uncharacterized protein [Nicotiana tomentosiformis]|uniref:uncharacterized protein n=1 Tax=Nicotiana tomentosiformis TaxID=4098 RepID=UPI00388C65E6